MCRSVDAKKQNCPFTEYLMHYCNLRTGRTSLGNDGLLYCRPLQLLQTSLNASGNVELLGSQSKSLFSMKRFSVALFSTKQAYHSNPKKNLGEFFTIRNVPMNLFFFINFIKKRFKYLKRMPLLADNKLLEQTKMVK